MEYTRNRDLSYYTSNCCRANCGSYALRLNEWYDPEECFDKLDIDLFDWIEEMALNGYSNYEITNQYVDILTEGMLHEFDNELELCDGRAPSTSDTELIALNGMCVYYETGDVDVDFHFKVLRDGHWSEKPGRDSVRFCELDDWGRYIGEPVYMYHKIDMKGVGDENDR